MNRLMLSQLRCLLLGHEWQDITPEYLSVYVEKKRCVRCDVNEDMSILLTVSRYRDHPQLIE